MTFRRSIEPTLFESFDHERSLPIYIPNFMESFDHGDMPTYTPNFMESFDHGDMPIYTPNFTEGFDS